jgi:hypothetical protein
MPIHVVEIYPANRDIPSSSISQKKLAEEYEDNSRGANVRGTQGCPRTLYYFSGLFRGHWADRGHTDFGTSIPAATLKALIDYLYIGAWDDLRLYNLDIDREELWIAADYLGFDRLVGVH